MCRRPATMISEDVGVRSIEWRSNFPFSIYLSRDEYPLVPSDAIFFEASHRSLLRSLSDPPSLRIRLTVIYYSATFLSWTPEIHSSCPRP